MIGYALLIGVNEVNRTYYGSELILPCAVDDVEGMKSLLIEMAEIKNIQNLTSINSSWNNIKFKIETIISENQESTEDVFLLIYYTGHGFSVKSECAPFDYNEVYSFYDKSISEFEIRELLNRFTNKKFKVLFIADTCHAGGLMEDNCPTNQLDPMTSSTKDLYVPLGNTKAMPNEVVEFILSQDFDIVKTEPVLLNTPAEIAVLAACKKGQFAEQNIGNSKYSLFTMYLLKNWANNKHRNLQCYTYLLQGKLNKHSSPVLFHHNTSLFFNSKSFLSMKNEATCTCKTDDFTEECDNSPIKVSIASGLEEFAHTHGSFTIDLTVPGAFDTVLFKELKKVIKAFDSQFPQAGVDTLSIVFLNEFGFGTPLPQYVFGMKCDDPCNPLENGYVALITTHGGWQCIKGKRTKGKVSNKLG